MNECRPNALDEDASSLVGVHSSAGVLGDRQRNSARVGHIVLASTMSVEFKSIGRQ
jgi:hypothetical protein